MFCFRLDDTRIDDVSLIDLGNSLSSNATFRTLRCVASFSYTQNSMKTFCQFLCDPSLLKGYMADFSWGAYLAENKATCSPASIIFYALMEHLMTKLINTTKMS